MWTPAPFCFCFCFFPDLHQVLKSCLFCVSRRRTLVPSVACFSLRSEAVESQAKDSEPVRSPSVNSTFPACGGHPTPGSWTERYLADAGRALPTAWAGGLRSCPPRGGHSGGSSPLWVACAGRGPSKLTGSPVVRSSPGGVASTQLPARLWTTGSQRELAASLGASRGEGIRDGSSGTEDWTFRSQLPVSAQCVGESK